MARTKEQMIAQLIVGFEDAGFITERGPFESRNEQGEVVLIAEHRVRQQGQLRLPLDEAKAEGGRGGD